MSNVLERLGCAEEGRILVAIDRQLEGIITRSDPARWIERGEMLESG